MTDGVATYLFQNPAALAVALVAAAFVLAQWAAVRDADAIAAAEPLNRWQWAAGLGLAALWIIFRRGNSRDREPPEHHHHHEDHYHQRDG